MNGESKNESFKLLQLSDESKSLSDLELPEIVNQRKRKVRRKTRPRTTSTRSEDDRSGPSIDCRNFGLWLAILMTILWLFIISYITSVVHSENRRLEIALQKISATSQNMPEALQKWHETSKNLEQNQTILNGKLREIQQVLSNFSIELKQLRDTMEKNNENSQEAQLNSLKTNVADLGSKIGDAITRIAVLEERYSTAQSEQKTLNKTVTDLETLFNQIRNNSSSSANAVAVIKSNITEQNIANVREQLSTQLANMAQNFTEELGQLKQKNDWLDNDLKANKANIDELKENSANVSSHVKSVENIWLEMKKNLTNVEGSSKLAKEQLELLQNSTLTLKGALAIVREECVSYHGQSETIASELVDIKERLTKVEQQSRAPPLVPNTTEPLKDTIPKNLSPLFSNSPTPSTIPKATGTGSVEPVGHMTSNSGKQSPTTNVNQSDNQAKGTQQYQPNSGVKVPVLPAITGSDTEGKEGMASSTGGSLTAATHSPSPKENTAGM